MKVLVVEDDRTSRILLEKSLLKNEHDVISTSGGEEALGAYKKNDFQIILLDWMMPEMDGLEVCKRIRKLEAKSSKYSYIIMVTAKTQTDDIVEALEAGADDFISKPIDLKTFMNKLERFLG